MAKQRSLADLVKVSEEQCRAKQEGTHDHGQPRDGSVDVAALQRALALAQSAYEQQEKRSPPINDSYTNFINDALR